MNEEREMTLEELVDKAEAEATQLKAKLAAKVAAERPNALAQVAQLIRTHSITRAELDEFVRKRPMVKRGPRSKPKAAAVPSLVVQTPVTVQTPQKATA